MLRDLNKPGDEVELGIFAAAVYDVAEALAAEGERRQNAKLVHHCPGPCEYCAAIVAGVTGVTTPDQEQEG
jgi:hypothetical protein